MSRTTLLVVLSFAWAHAATAAPPKSIDYDQHIRPILETNCWGCHGADAQESDLRLDSVAAALEGGSSGPAIVPGRSAESRLIQALNGTEDVTQMPPEGEGDQLTPDEIALLRAWIDAGAKGPATSAAETAAGPTAPRSNHWSFQPVRDASPPAVQRGNWARNPLDAFILARLESAGVTPAPEADRATLIRRVSLDMIGLPPTPAEIDAFLADQSPDAYEKLVDRLLASPHYGERWGRHWLDLARYADSNGYTVDNARSIWKYRDWVIGALNRNLSFDQFVIEQLAGDLLPKPTTEQLIATGFHRNTLINDEGGADPEQFRVEAVVDRANTTGAVFLGLTLACAQCHSHKFDPISHKDYYRFYAFFNGADEPTLSVPSPAQSAELEARAREVAAEKKQIEAREEEIARDQAEWERGFASALPVVWRPLDPIEYRSVAGATVEKLDDHSLLVSGKSPERDTYTLTADVPPSTTGIKLEAMADERLPGGGPGRTPSGGFALSEIIVRAGPGDSSAAVQPVKIADGAADDFERGREIQRAFDGKLETSWTVALAPDNIGKDVVAFFYLGEPLAPRRRLAIELVHNDSIPASSFGRFRILTTDAPAPLLALRQSTQQFLAMNPLERTPQQREQIRWEFMKAHPRWAPVAAKLEAAKEREEKCRDSIPTTMIVRERAKPRESFVHLRGDFLRKGAVVTPGVPAVLPAIDATVQSPTRLDLARWLIDRRNPLTARVTVNRIWQKYFGVGLVETENDFGVQGTPPSHPELLDWLASRFMQDWDVKRLHRLIVTSATYRQSSAMRRELASLDPRNKLLARQARLRLDAETIRDSALAAAGLLSAKVGGPSAYPPQPPEVFRFTQSLRQWPESRGEDRYRRGLYTFFWRSSPYPFLMTFDAPNANATCTRRNTSNTPLQALALANDRVFLEAAQSLGARILRDAPADDQQRIRYGLRLCMGREPTAAESARLLEFVERQTTSFRSAKAEDVSAVLGSPASERAEPAQAAAWVATARVLLNLDEFITRE